MHEQEVDGIAPELASLMAGRIGAFRRAEVLGAGYSDEEIRARLDSGRWLTLRRGVYCRREQLERASLDADRMHLLMAEGLAAASGERPTFSHGTAVRIHNLDHLRGIGSRIHLTRARRPALTTSVDREVDVHVAGLPAEHIVSGTLFDATSVPRTVADMARYASYRDAIVIGNSALRTKKASRCQIESVLRTMTRWPGVRQARLVVGHLDARAETAIESLALAVWWEQRLPTPVLQVWVYDVHGLIGVVDGMWMDRLVAYETDGLLKYRQFGADALTKEKLRQERLEQAGLQIRRFTWPELWNAGKSCADRTRKAFHRAAALPPPRVRLYVADPDRPVPVDSARTLPAELGLELAYDGLPTPIRGAKWVG